VGTATREQQEAKMVRLIKRYESRKLYDTEESRYVSLDEIADWVRSDQEVRVIDNATSQDVTAQTLTQVILDEGRDGHSLPSELLHDLVRFGARALSSGVEQAKQGVDSFVRSSIDRLTPVREAREEMTSLRDRLEELERSLSKLEATDPAGSGMQAARRSPAKATKKAVKKAVKKATRKKAAKKATRKKAVRKTAKKN
jgi:polyhydroxyalkanoate synthesis repressor PhaR